MMYKEISWSVCICIMKLNSANTAVTRCIRNKCNNIWYYIVIYELWQTRSNIQNVYYITIRNSEIVHRILQMDVKIN